MNTFKKKISLIRINLIFLNGILLNAISSYACPGGQHPQCLVSNPFGGCAVEICVPDFVPQNVDVIGSTKKALEDIPKTDFQRNSGLRDVQQSAEKIITSIGEIAIIITEPTVGSVMKGVGSGIKELTGENEIKRKKEADQRNKIRDYRQKISVLDSEINEANTEKSNKEGRIEGMKDTVEVLKSISEMKKEVERFKSLEKLVLNLVGKEQEIQLIADKIKEFQRDNSLASENQNNLVDALEKVALELNDESARKVQLEIVNQLKQLQKSPFFSRIQLSLLDFFSHNPSTDSYSIHQTLFDCIVLLEETIDRIRLTNEANIKTLETLNARVTELHNDIESKKSKRDELVLEMQRAWW